MPIEGNTYFGAMNYLKGKKIRKGPKWKIYV